MNEKDNATYQEIVSQPRAWQEALDIVAAQSGALCTLWEKGRYDNVMFTGCGSTYYLSLAAASLWRDMIDGSARAMPGGELYLQSNASYGAFKNRRTLLIAVSRSGETSETVAATRQFKTEKRGDVIVVTVNSDSPLAKLGDITLAMNSGQEKSVAQTRSFAAMYVATTALTATIAEKTDLLAAMKDLPHQGEKLIAKYEPSAQTIGSNLETDRFYFLGSGHRYGLACEANLKMKELSLTHSEPFYTLEFRHGPKAMVNRQTMIIGLQSDRQSDHENRVLQEMEKLGGNICTIGNDRRDISFHSDIPESVRNVLFLPPLQLMAYHRAVAKGLNPDRPNNLSSVVELDLTI